MTLTIEKTSNNVITVTLPERENHYPKNIIYEDKEYVYGTKTSPPESYKSCAIYFLSDWIYT